MAQILRREDRNILYVPHFYPSDIFGEDVNKLATDHYDEIHIGTYDMRNYDVYHHVLPRREENGVPVYIDNILVDPDLNISALLHMYLEFPKDNLKLIIEEFEDWSYVYLPLIDEIQLKELFSFQRRIDNLQLLEANKEMIEILIQTPLVKNLEITNEFGYFMSEEDILSLLRNQNIHSLNISGGEIDREKICDLLALMPEKTSLVFWGETLPQCEPILNRNRKTRSLGEACVDENRI